MQRLSSILAIVLLVFPSLSAGEILDRLAATVNGHALLQSEVDEELRYECFVSNKALQDLTVGDRTAALDRLIDQELLRQQMRSADFTPVKREETDKALETLKAEYANTNKNESWTSALASYGISESTVRSHIEIELNQLHLIELRLRPSIQIDSDTIKAYYREQLLPKLPQGQHTSLEEATPTIREILLQQKMNESLESWIQALRSQAQIQRVDATTGVQTQ
jgi:parvulin-like peptidyl-prolyl isomerase